MKKKAHTKYPTFQRRKHRAIGSRIPERGVMNKTEEAYAAWLKLRSDVSWWGFECWTFVLPGGVRFTPDFAVQLRSGFFELVDVKAFYKGTQKPGVKDDALVKIKIAAATYPMFTWKFVWCEPHKGWVDRVFGDTRVVHGE